MTTNNHKNTLQDKPRYDLVLCIGPQHVGIACITIQHIIRYFSPTNIYLITDKDHFQRFHELKNLQSNLHLIDENSLLINFTYRDACDFLIKKTSFSDRAGWYFQQFLKMEAHKLVKESHYLIWDADSIPFQHINFFDDRGNTLVHPGGEHHLPYFDTLKRMLDLEKQVPFSFISEHMMVSTKIMMNLVEEISSLNKALPWPINVLNNIPENQLSLSGFSEYETYGNYSWSATPSTLRLRSSAPELLHTYRFGAKLFGALPAEDDLYFFRKMRYHYVTFEVWDSGDIATITHNRRLSTYFRLIAYFWPLSLLKKVIARKIIRQM